MEDEGECGKTRGQQSGWGQIRGCLTVMANTLALLLCVRWGLNWSFVSRQDDLSPFPPLPLLPPPPLLLLLPLLGIL